VKIYVLIPKQVLVISVIILLMVMGSLYLVFIRKENVLPVNSNHMGANKLEERIQSITKNQEKIAFLTFDDGPNRNVTPKVLDILEQNDIKATFFVIGKYVGNYPEIVKRAYEEGHYIANHSYSHNNTFLYKNDESFIKEIQKTDEAIAKAIGKVDYHSYLFRFPNGYMAPLHKVEKERCARLLTNMQYTYIDWNCLNNDSMKKYNKMQLLENLKKSAKNKNVLVILMHDTKDVSDSSEVLQDSIDYLKAQGYIFKNFYDL